MIKLQQRTALLDTLCTCEQKPLGLNFVLTAGCLVHDQCSCHSGPSGAPLHPGEWGECLWCDSYMALLKSIASLDEVARQRLKRAYLAERR